MFAKIEEAIEDFRRGKMVIVVDDEDRENEGDFIMAAEKVTPEAVNFMAKHGRGLICVAAPPEHIEKLGLDMMVERNTALMGTPFTVSIDAREGTTTGISAYDRAITIKKFASPDAKPEDFARPGHVFPLKARAGGVLRRAGFSQVGTLFARALIDPWELCIRVHDTGFLEGRCASPEGTYGTWGAVAVPSSMRYLSTPPGSTTGFTFTTSPGGGGWSGCWTTTA